MGALTSRNLTHGLFGSLAERPQVIEVETLLSGTFPISGHRSAFDDVLVAVDRAQQQLIRLISLWLPLDQSIAFLTGQVFMTAGSHVPATHDPAACIQ